MNERIKELALQAGLQQRVWNSLGKELPMWQEDPDNPGLEKFAELIVKECIDIAKHHVMNISTYGDAEFVDEQIKEHFGVEE